MKMPIRFDKDSENIVTITFDAPGARVNTMTAEWQTAFTETVARLASEIQREKTLKLHVSQPGSSLFGRTDQWLGGTSEIAGGLY